MCAGSTVALWTLAAGAALICCGSARGLFAQTVAPGAEQADRLRGTVVNGLTHEPIGRALVLSPDNRFATLTDERGRFEFALPRVEGQHVDQASSGTGGPTTEIGQSSAQFFTATIGAQPQLMKIRNDRPNFLTARKTGFLFENNEMQGVPVAPDQEEVTISLVPEARIVGHVMLPGSEAASGMQVELYRRQVQNGRVHWDAAGNATARSDGEFRFAELPSGAYKVSTREFLDRDPVTSNRRAQVFGFPPVYYPAAADFATGAVIRLTAGETSEANLSPAKREYYSVKMGVANATAGVQPDVQVWRQGHEGPGYSLGYNVREGAIEGLLPNGSYTVQVTSNGPNSLTGISNIAVSGAPVSGVVVTLVPSVSIEVRVREDLQHQTPEPTTMMTVANGVQRNFTVNGRRPNYLQATLVPVEEFGFKPTYSLRPPTGPEDETLVIENVMPGRYRVQVETGVGYVASIDCGGTDLHRLPLEIGFGASPPQIEITVRDDGGEVQGSIVESAKSGSPSRTASSPVQMPGVVYLAPIGDSGQMKQAWLDPNGNFRAEQVAPGRYRVLAFEHQRPDLEFANEEMMSRYDSKAQIVTVAAGQSENLRLTLIMENE
jgi:hypothetical protein